MTSQVMTLMREGVDVGILWDVAELRRNEGPITSAAFRPIEDIFSDMLAEDALTMTLFVETLPPALWDDRKSGDVVTYGVRYGEQHLGEFAARVSKVESTRVRKAEYATLSAVLTFEK